MLVDVVSVVVRAVSFIALLHAVGATVSGAMLAPLPVTTAHINRRVGSTTAWLAMALVISHQLLAATLMSGNISGLLDLAMQYRALHTSAGAANAVRVLGLLVIAITLRKGGNGRRVTAIAGGWLVVLSFLMTGHSTAHAQRALLAPLLLVHVWVVAFWFGGLLVLYVAVVNETATVAAALVARFSRLATWLVPCIAIAGAIMAVTLLPDSSALLTPYGLLLLVKVAGFVLLTGLATLNKWRFGPAVARRNHRATQLFGYCVIAEYFLMCLALAVTAAMTGWFSPDL